jgi:hypothetical protein
MILPSLAERSYVADGAAAPLPGALMARKEEDDIQMDERRERVLLQQTSEAVRSALGEDAFNSAYAEGRGLTAAAAIKLALAVTTSTEAS